MALSTVRGQCVYAGSCIKFRPCFTKAASAITDLQDAASGWDAVEGFGTLFL